jgi:purine nucleosidase
MTKRFLTVCALMAVATLIQSAAFAEPPAKVEPVKIIFDTDIGNDVDDVLALGMLHALETRGDCEILAVTVTKPDELAGPFVDVIDTFYDRLEIPIGCIHPLATEPAGKFLSLANIKDDGKLRYPHKLLRGSDAVAPSVVLRKTLSAQPDHSVVLVQVGYFSNFAALLDTPGDEFSPLTGKELVMKKVRLMSVMGGKFKSSGPKDHLLEFNVIKDLPATKKLVKEWPTPMVWSGAEIGVAVPYPAISIERDFNYVTHHPVSEAYYLYKPPPHERPTWDLTSSLYAVLPDRGYFDLSEPGRVVLEPDGFTRFEPDPNGRDRYLILPPNKIARLKEAMVQLVSQPPSDQCK